jgi:hypothetical protein
MYEQLRVATVATCQAPSIDWMNMGPKVPIVRLPKVAKAKLSKPTATNSKGEYPHGKRPFLSVSMKQGQLIKLGISQSTAPKSFDMRNVFSEPSVEMCA